MRRKKWLCYLILVLCFTGTLHSQKMKEPPVETVKRIGDKLIRETPFAYRLVRAPHNNTFYNLRFIDFARTFGTDKPAVAYAFTQLTSTVDTLMTIEIEHNDACVIWCNSRVVYKKEGVRPLNIKREERSMEMSFSFSLPLRKGQNDILIKSETAGSQWCVLLQPPSHKDAVLPVRRIYPEIGLHRTVNIDKQIADLSNWLVVGPFAPGINTVHAPEQELRFGQMYPGREKLVTWTIPRMEVLGDVIDPAPWGTTYQWNYHNGGVAWAMQHLGELTRDEKYTRWGDDFCDFQVEGMPFVDYQVNTLQQYNSANAQVIQSNLLDFTLAPSIPLIYRLRTEKTFKNRDVHHSFIVNMMDYARLGQIRSEGMSNYTRNTPVEFTVWVDDMFMGIPFLIQAALYTTDPLLKKEFLDDAAEQILDFNKHVWNKDSRLYMHANYTSRTEIKLPHWSRANGWALWAMSEVLMELPQNHPRYKAILKQYRTFVESLIRYQSSSGLWHNVIDRSDSPEETSGSAIFTMAMARGIRYGWLNEKKYTPVVMKAWEGIASQIEEDGTIHNICVGTMCTEDIDYYMNRPFYDDDTHGSFAVMFAGIEIQRLLNNTGVFF